MKIAYLVQAHCDVCQLIRLCKALVQSGDVFIHIDRKTNDVSFFQKLKLFVAESKNVYVLPDRINVAWGGYSQVECFANLLHCSLKKEKVYDRFVLLSGLDFPLWSPEKIISYFEKNRDVEFVRGYNISYDDKWELQQKIVLYHFFRDIPLAHRSFLRRAVIGGTKLCLKYLGIKRKPFWVVGKKNNPVYFGSQWVAVTRRCALYLVEEIFHNPEVKKYFSTVYAPDELCVPTLVLNSEFRDKAFEIKDYTYNNIVPLHFLKYENYIWSYDETDFQMLMDSNKMFVRKLISGKSEKLIEKIIEFWEKDNSITS